MNLIDSFVRSPVKVTVGVLLVALFGVVALARMPMQLTPEVQTPTITVETRWPGASPQEVEKEIIIEQEEQLKSVEGVTKMTSESSDSMGRIILEFTVGTDMGKAVIDVLGRLEQVPEYPEDADKPIITTANASDRPIAWFILSIRDPSDEELAAFQKKHPEIADEIQHVRAAQNSGVEMLRLRMLAEEHQAVRTLLPPLSLPASLPTIERIERFQAEHPEYTDALDTVRAADDPDEKMWLLKELGEKHFELKYLLHPENFDVTQLRLFAEDEIEARFERIDGVSQGNVIGGLEDELQVIVDPEALAARQLTITDVRNVLRGQNEDVSAGDFWEGKRRWVVRTLGQFESPEQVEQQLLAVRDGSPVYVRDVAEVRLDYKKPDGLVRHFGESSIAINAVRETGANVLDVMEGLRQVNKELNEGLLADKGLVLAQVYDETDYIYSSVNLVRENIFMGAALTMIVLMAFLHLGVRAVVVMPLILVAGVASVYVSSWFFVICLALIIGAGFWFARGALVIGLAIPTSIIGTFLILGMLGRSLNVISLAGLAFAVGMLVDNSIVVLENIYHRYSLGERPFTAAIKGTQEVVGAVLASTLTTVAVFLPIVFIQEEAGQLFRDIALAISAAVGLSLVVSVIVIPPAAARLFSRRGGAASEMSFGEAVGAPAAGSNGHAQGNGHPQGHHAAADGAAPASGFAETARRVIVGPVEWFGAAFVASVVGLNNWVQKSLLRQAGVVVALTGAAFVLSWLFWPKVEYLPSGNRNLVFGILLPPPGYNLDELMAMGRKVESDLKPYWDVEADSPAAQKLDFPVIDDFFFVARGRQVFLGIRAADASRAAELIPLVQKVGSQLPGTFAVAKQSSLFEQGLTGGRTVEIEITGPDLEKLVAIGGQILGGNEQLGMKPVSVVAGVVGADGQMKTAQARPVPSLDLSSPELHVEPKLLQSAEMGVSTTDLGYTVNALVDGAYAGDYYLGGNKIDLSIRGEDEYAARTQDVRALAVATPEGHLVPLEALAEVTLSSGPEQINHRERLRAITIEVSPPPEMPLEDAMLKIQSEIVEPLIASGQITPGYRMNLAGTADKLRDTWEALWVNLLLALLITYLLMAALFESWLYPFVVIFSVPLGAVGGILGLWILNLFVLQTLDVLTMLGFVILIGTVVNNPILIVHQSLNHIREDGMTPREAILESTRTRIRPIFMTTTTTVLGLLPLVVFPGAGSELYRGLGAVVLGGLVVSTVFTLALVPALFSLTMRAKDSILGLFRAASDEPKTPAQPEEPSPFREQQEEPIAAG
jgi:HAE1 family hydrophobic/amphiphilic exporter-1